jgi:hypothetical protein
VEAHVGACNEVVEQVGVEDAAEDELDIVAVPQVLDVLQAPGREVVEEDHRVAPREQRVGEVGADEPGSAGDEGAHGTRAYVSGSPSVYMCVDGCGWLTSLRG